MHYPKRTGNSKKDAAAAGSQQQTPPVPAASVLLAGNAAAPPPPPLSSKFGLVAKAHPAVAAVRGNEKPKQQQQREEAEKEEDSKKNQQQQPHPKNSASSEPLKGNFEVVSLRSPRPPPATEQQQQQPQQPKTARVSTTTTTNTNGTTTTTTSVTARTGSGAVAAAAVAAVSGTTPARTDSQASLSAPENNNNKADDNDKNSRALVPTPKSSSIPLIPILTSPTSKAPTSSLLQLSDSKLPVVGGSFIAQQHQRKNNRNNNNTGSSSAIPPSVAHLLRTSFGESSASLTAAINSNNNLPPVTLARSSLMQQQQHNRSSAAHEPFASVRFTRQQQQSDVGAALTIYSPPAPSGPLAKLQRPPRHWTEMLPSFAELESSAGVGSPTAASSSSGPASSGGSPVAAGAGGQFHHSVPPLAAELLSWTRKELRMIYAPLFESDSRGQQQQQQNAASGSSSSNTQQQNTTTASSSSKQQLQIAQQLVFSPEVKLSRWRVFLDAYRNLCTHFKEYGPLMTIMLREFEDMYAALQQHGSDRALFSLVANNAEGVAAELAKETTKNVFDELAMTKQRNQSLQQTIAELNKEIVVLREKLSVASDEKMRLGSDLDMVTNRCKTLIEALQGEANRQNATFAEVKMIREENMQLKIDLRSREEQAKKDSLLQEELFSKLDQLSLAMSEGGLDFTKVMAATSARNRNGNHQSGGGGGGDYDDDEESPYQQNRENIHSLEGMRRWGSMLHMNLMRAQDAQSEQQQQGGDGSLDDDEWTQKRRRHADRRLSTVLEGLLTSSPGGNQLTGGGAAPPDADDDNNNNQHHSPSASSFSSSSSPAHRVVTEAKRDRDSMLRERMIRESMKFAASCSGDSAAERLQEALLRCFAKVRKYRGTIGVLRQTIERLEKKVQKLGSAAAAAMSNNARHGSVHNVFGSSGADATTGGGGVLQPSWSMVANSNNNMQNSGSFEPMAPAPTLQFAGGGLNNSGIFGGSGSGGGGGGYLLNAQQSVNIRPSEAAELARFDSARPLTPRPLWNRLTSVVPSFKPAADPETGVFPSSDEILEQLAEKLRDLQSEKLKEVERKVLSKRVSGWLEEEHGNSKTHQVRSAKASDITSLLMASSRSFVGLGGGPEVPLYLRYTGRLRNKLLGKGDAEVLLKRFWKARRESMLPSLTGGGGGGGGGDDETNSNISDGVSTGGIGGGHRRLSDLAPELASGAGSSSMIYSSVHSSSASGIHEASYATTIEDFYQQWLQQQTGNPKAAIELAYSLNDVCERYQHDPDCGMFLKIMRGVISEQCLAHEIYVVEQLRKVFTDLDTHNNGQLPRALVYRVLKQLFPSKRYGEALRLRFALIPFTSEDEQGHAFVRYLDLFEEDSEGNQTTFIERLRHQHFDEALEVLVEIESAVRETQQTTGARRNEMPLWQIAHAIRNVDARMPTSAIIHILSVGSGLPPRVVQDALDRHASDVKVDVEDLFRRVRRGVYVRRYSAPPEDDVALLEDEADDADVEDAEYEGGAGGGGADNNDADAQRLEQLIKDAEDDVNAPPVSASTPQASSINPPFSTATTSTSARHAPAPPPRSPLQDEPLQATPAAHRREQQQHQQQSPRQQRGRVVQILSSPSDNNASFGEVAAFAGDGEDLLTM